LARKFVDKYSKLQSAFSQTLFVFRKKPEKFFESPAFIDELLKAANKLNEDVTLDPEMSKALGLEAGKDRENIQKIIAGLEKIRKEVIEALSKKEQLVKERPKGEEEQAGGDQQNQLNENKELYAKANALLKREKSFYDEVNTAVDSYLKDDSDENIKKILTSFKKRKRFADFKENVEKIQDLMQAVEEQRKGAQTVVNKFRAGKGLTMDGFKKDIEAVGNYTQAYETLQQAVPSEKQDSKPIPLVPTAIDQVEGNTLTIQGEGGNTVTVTKEEAKATYDIITAADKFIRIYTILMQYLYKIAPKEIEEIIPDKKILQIDVSKPLVEPEKVPLQISSPPEQPNTDDDTGEPADVEGDDSMRYARKKALELYVDNLQFDFEQFEKGFLTVQMLGLQSSLYTELDNALVSYKKAVEQTAGAISKGEEEEKPAKRDDLYEAQEVKFDDEEMSLFKTEYNKLLKLSKFLSQTVEKIESPEDLERIKGDEIVRQIRKIAEKLQESIGKVHDVVINELKSDIEFGKKLKEQEEQPESSDTPSDDSPRVSGIQDPSPYDDHSTEGESKRVQANKRSWEQKVKDIENVYERVVNQLTLLTDLLESNEPRIEARKVNQLIQTSLKSLDSIRTFFPSQSPFGKRMPEGTSPLKYINDMKRKVKQIVRQIVDIARQLKSTISNKPKLEEREGVFKDITDPENVAKFATQLKAASALLQDYFDAPSKIGEVVANRPAKISNAENAASINDEGNKAVKAGKIEEPEYSKEEEQEKESINNYSQAASKLNTYRDKVKKIQDELSDLTSDIREVSALNFNSFLSSLVVLLNKFPEANEEVATSITGNIESPTFKMYKIDKQKLDNINRLIKIDRTGGLSIMINAIKKDNIGAKKLKSLISKYLPKDISFNLNFKEIKKFFEKSKKEEPKQEQLERKIEQIIEHYLNNRM
jgi:siroheme synthase (precorrin-2 oxidase/ferrochelatase)